MTEEAIQSVMNWVMIIILITGLLASIAFVIHSIFFYKLPPWFGLYGEEYRKWKRGEKAKSDNSD